MKTGAERQRPGCLVGDDDFDMQGPILQMEQLSGPVAEGADLPIAKRQACSFAARHLDRPGPLEPVAVNREPLTREIRRDRVKGAPECEAATGNPV